MKSLGYIISFLKNPPSHRFKPIISDPCQMSVKQSFADIALAFFLKLLQIFFAAV